MAVAPIKFRLTRRRAFGFHFIYLEELKAVEMDFLRNDYASLFVYLFSSPFGSIGTINCSRIRVKIVEDFQKVARREQDRTRLILPRLNRKF